MLDIPLPEINHSDFEKVWTRFELVVVAQEWNGNRQFKIILTLLNKKLLDCCMGLSAEEKSEVIAQNTEEVPGGKVRFDKGPFCCRKTIHNTMLRFG